MRARTWTFITYPESMPEEWESMLEDRLMVPFIQSPLHDQDIAEQGKGWNGTEYKKPHYHNMIMFTNVKSYKQVSDMVRFLGAGHVQQVHSTQAMVRYFIHADQPKKTQYLKENIRAWNGADIDHIWEKNDKEIHANLDQLFSLISDNDLIEYKLLVDHCRKHEPELFPLVVGSYAFVINQYIKSQRHQERPPKYEQIK